MRHHDVAEMTASLLPGGAVLFALISLRVEEMASLSRLVEAGRAPPAASALICGTVDGEVNGALSAEGGAMVFSRRRLPSPLLTQEHLAPGADIGSLNARAGTGPPSGGGCLYIRRI